MRLAHAFTLYLVPSDEVPSAVSPSLQQYLARIAGYEDDGGAGAEHATSYYVAEYKGARCG